MPFTKHSHGGWGGSGETKPLHTPQDKGPVFPRRGTRGFSQPDVLPRQTPCSHGPRPATRNEQKKAQ
jgi:hypothetical protein